MNGQTSASTARVDAKLQGSADKIEPKHREESYVVKVHGDETPNSSRPAVSKVPDHPRGTSTNVLPPDHENLHEFVRRARNVSLFSIAFTLVCAIVGLAFAWSTQSSALLGYALEALVDVWSSILVLWRFWKDPDGEGHYFLITRRRESRASVGIAFTFVIIGVFTSSLAIVHLTQRQPPANSSVLLAISGTSIIILTWSCATKLSLSRVLQSNALRKDAVTSGACACMAGAILVSTSVHKSNPSIWWLDACVAVVISCILGVLGVRTLVRNPWWTREFWSDDTLPPEEKQAACIMDMSFSPRKQRQHALQAQQAQHELAARPSDINAPHRSPNKLGGLSPRSPRPHAGQQAPASPSFSTGATKSLKLVTDPRSE